MNPIMYAGKACHVNYEITLEVIVPKQSIAELRKISRMTSGDLHEKFGTEYGEPCAGIRFETTSEGHDIDGFFDYFLGDVPDDLPEFYAEVYDATDDEIYVVDDGENYAIETGASIVLEAKNPDSKSFSLKIKEG